MTKSTEKRINELTIKIKSNLEKIASSTEGMRKIWDLVDEKTDAGIDTDQDAINFLAYFQALEICK